MAKLVPVDPFDIVIFGGPGDLSGRKLMPARTRVFIDMLVVARGGGKAGA